MKRIRAVGILIKDNDVLLIYRKNIKEYFVFPGGGVEENETVEEAVIRELKEETTLEVKINKLLYHHIYDDDTEQYFYLCDYVKGEPKLSEDSEEKEKILRGEDYYNPMWVQIEKLKDMLIYPLEIRDLLVQDFKDNFKNSEKTFNFRISELRKDI